MTSRDTRTMVPTWHAATILGLATALTIAATVEFVQTGHTQTGTAALIMVNLWYAAIIDHKLDRILTSITRPGKEEGP